MKAEFIILNVMLGSVLVHAQGESVGIGSPGPILGPTWTPEYDQNLKINLSKGQPFRVVNGKVYNVLQSQLWEPISGEVHYVTDDGSLILYDYNGLTASVALKNYSGDATSGKEIQALAIHTGTYNWTGQPLQLWDCGTPYIPPLPTPEQIRAAQETAKIAAQREAQKQLIAQSNAVVWLLSQATNGDAGAQCSLGEHFLNGQGCQTNREQGIYWLQKAASQGNIEASNKLVSLKK